MRTSWVDLKGLPDDALTCPSIQISTAQENSSRMSLLLGLKVPPVQWWEPAEPTSTTSTTLTVKWALLLITSAPISFDYLA